MCVCERLSPRYAEHMVHGVMVHSCLTPNMIRMCLSSRMILVHTLHDLHSFTFTMSWQEIVEVGLLTEIHENTFLRSHCN